MTEHVFSVIKAQYLYKRINLQSPGYETSLLWQTHSLQHQYCTLLSTEIILRQEFYLSPSPRKKIKTCYQSNYRLKSCGFCFLWNRLCCFLSVPYLISLSHQYDSFYKALVALNVEGTLLLNNQPKTDCQGAKRSCSSVQTNSEETQVTSYAANIYELESTWASDPLYLQLQYSRG